MRRRADRWTAALVMVGALAMMAWQAHAQIAPQPQPKQGRQTWVTLGEAVITDRPIEIRLPAHRVGAYSRVGVLPPRDARNVKLQRIIFNEDQALRVSKPLTPGRVTSIMRKGSGQSQVIRTITIIASSPKPVRLKVVGVPRPTARATEPTRSSTQVAARASYPGWTLLAESPAASPRELSFAGRACATTLGFTLSSGSANSKLTLIDGAVRHTLYAKLSAGAIKSLDLSAPYLHMKRVRSVRWEPNGKTAAGARVAVYCKQ